MIDGIMKAFRCQRCDMPADICQDCVGKVEAELKDANSRAEQYRAALERIVAIDDRPRKESWNRMYVDAVLTARHALIEKPKDFAMPLCDVQVGCFGQCGKLLPCEDHPAAQKRICEHDWEHIEDCHYFCAKCKTATDLCPTCGTEKVTDNVGRLLCPKCNG